MDCRVKPGNDEASHFLIRTILRFRRHEGRKQQTKKYRRIKD